MSADLKNELDKLEQKVSQLETGMQKISLSSSKKFTAFAKTRLKTWLLSWEP